MNYWLVKTPPGWSTLFISPINRPDPRLSFIGGFGFFTTGISSYLQKELLPFTKVDSIAFIPQGIVMTFYGTIGLLLSFFLILNIILNIGGGYNKYDKKNDLCAIKWIYRYKHEISTISYIACIKILQTCTS